MKTILVTIIIFLFFAPLAMATGGGPSFEQLYKQSRQGKPVVELIDKSSKKVRKQQICFINVGQNKVEKKTC